MSKKSLKIQIPDYTFEEELVNSISHGLGAVFSITALVLLIMKAHSALEAVSVSIFGFSMVILYMVSYIYHALPPEEEVKKVMRLMDHCTVNLLIFGTYIPAALLGVKNKLGWVLFGTTSLFTLLGIILTCINLDRYRKLRVICCLINGWSLIAGFPLLLKNVGKTGVLYMFSGGLMYSIGAGFYAMGTRKKYFHSIFHIFCLLGTIFHFWAIYKYLL